MAVERPRVSDSTWQSWLNYGQNYYGSFEEWYGSYYGSSAVSGLQYDIEYTPDVGFGGTDTFTYTIEDAQGAQSSATVSVAVAGNQSPDAVDDSVATDPGTAGCRGCARQRQ